MVVGAARNDPQAFIGQAGGQRFGIGDDLRGIGLEFRLQCIAEGHSLGRDHMDQRAALQTREHRRVELFGERFVIGQDDPRTRPAQALVRGRGDDMGVREGRGVRAARNKAGKVRYIGEQIGAHFIGDFAEPGKVPVARVGSAAADDQLGLMLTGQGSDRVHVDLLVLGAHAIGDRLEPLAAHVDGTAVGQVPARIEIEPHKGVAGIEQREEHRLVHLAARIGLNVGEFAAEQFLCPFNCQRFDHVGIFAAAIVALARIALSVFVCEDRTGRFQHGQAGDVFGRDQFDVAALAFQLVLNRGMNFGIGFGQMGSEKPGGADGVSHRWLTFRSRDWRACRRGRRGDRRRSQWKETHQGKPWPCRFRSAGRPWR